MKPASQTGLKLPAMEDLLPEQYAGDDTVLPYDPAKANQMLDAAGYEKGADGKRTKPDGSPLAVDFSVQAGFIDYQAIADVVADNLNDLGRRHQGDASPRRSRWTQQKKTGDFQSRPGVPHGGCEIARDLGAKLQQQAVPDRAPTSCPTSGAAPTRPPTRRSPEPRPATDREASRRRSSASSST